VLALVKRRARIEILQIGGGGKPDFGVRAGPVTLGSSLRKINDHSQPLKSGKS